MRPTTIWIATALLALGICGLLDAAGVVDSAETIGQWWPLAVIGFTAAGMLDERRITLGGVVCAAVGVALLADTQAWMADAVVWSSLAIAVGLAIAVSAMFGRHHGNGDAPTAVGGAS